MTWQLRRASEADLDAVMAIETPVFGSDAWPRSAMASELRSAHTYYLVAHRVETPDAIEGYAGLLAPAGSGQGDIQTIAVAESGRRMGLGRILMLTLIAEARDRGAAEIFLEVRADNPDAHSLYLSLGFQQIAVRPRYYQPDGVDAIIMKRAVEQPELTAAAGAAASSAAIDSAATSTAATNIAATTDGTSAQVRPTRGQVVSS
jgi:ribosomal-protein-alanine acetyltransferase